MKRARGSTVTALLVVGIAAISILALPLTALFLEVAGSGPLCQSSLAGLPEPQSNCWEINQILLKLTYSAATAGIAALFAAAVGAALAVATRLLPARVGAATDVLYVLPLTVSPFVLGASLDQLLGRTSLLAPLLHYRAFAGVAPMVFTFVLSYFPLAYFTSRAALAPLDRSRLEILQLHGFRGVRLLRFIWRDFLRLPLPAITAVIFGLALSDPLVPSFVGGRTPNLAQYVFSNVSAYGDPHLAAVGAAVAAVVAGIVATGVSLHGIRHRRHHPSPLNLNLASSPHPNPGTAAPVTALRVPAYALISMTSAAVVAAALPILWALVGALKQAAQPQTQLSLRVPMPPSVMVNTAEYALVTFLVASVTVFAGLELRRRGWGPRLIDGLFASFILVPGVSLGTGFTFAVSSTGSSATSQLFAHGLAANRFGAALIVVAYLTVSIPLFYFSVRHLSVAVEPRTREAALLLGLPHWRATLLATVPALRTFSLVALGAVLASCVVTVSPLMWLTSPDSPVVIPYLFALIDHGSTGQAFTIAGIFSLAICSLLLAIRWALQLAASIPHKRRR